MEDKEQILFQQLKKELSEQYEGASIDQWTHYDFSKISESIEEKTGQPLSVSTLKRLFGRMQSNNKLSYSSLDIISQFLNYEDWIHFKNTHNAKSTTKSNSLALIINWKLVFGITLILTISIAILYFFQIKELNSDKHYKVNKERAFEFYVVDSIGDIPNEVELHYDISKLKGSQFTISYPSDKNDKVIIKKDTLINFYIKKPGVSLVKLKQNDSVLSKVRIFNTTKGWMASVFRESKYKLFQFDEDEIRNDGILTIEKEKFASDIAMSHFKEVDYINAKVSTISMDTFTYITRFRYIKINGYDICTKVYFTLGDDNENYLSIPFAHQSCFKGMPLFLNNQVIDLLGNTMTLLNGKK